MEIGYLKIQLASVRQVVPIEGTSIRIYKEKHHELVHESFHVSDELGSTSYIALKAPLKKYAMNKQNEVCPYETYHVEIRHQSFENIEVIGVQIFAQQYTTLPVVLKPIVNTMGNGRILYFIKEHMLFKSPRKRMLHQDGYYYEKRVHIPNQISVHIGKPSRYGDTIFVDFIYYIKNVACCEIYPTWEKEAIKASVYKMIHQTLQRIHTKHYVNKGFHFDVCSDAMYDLCFVRNKEIHDYISEVVDEIFNAYMQIDQDNQEITQEDDLWSYQEEALQGKKAMEILQSKNHVTCIVSNNALQGIPQTFPGVVIREGSKGKDVKQIQYCLLAMKKMYPHFANLVADGIYGVNTLACIQAFQTHFSLQIDGQVGKQTWYKIMYLYSMFYRISNLQQIRQEYSFPLTQVNLIHKVKQVEEVMCVQYMLNVVAFYDRTQPCFLSIDGIFDKQSERAITTFQKQYGIALTGLVDEVTYTRLLEVSNTYWLLLEGKEKRVAYPDQLSFLGVQSKYVKDIQKALNTIGSKYSSFLPLIEDGCFNQDTKHNVKIFQSFVGLDKDGIVAKQTWDALFMYARYCSIGKESLLIEQKVRILFCLGSKGEDVQLLQTMIQRIQLTYFPTHALLVDGIYGMQTRELVIQIQKMLGIKEDGHVDQELYTLITQMYTQLEKEG